MKKTPSATLDPHGATELPSVVVRSYNLEVRDDTGFVGDRASQRAFRKMLDRWRKKTRHREEADDPLAAVPTAELDARQIDRSLMREPATPMTVAVHRAIDEFALELAGVVKRFARQKDWSGVQRIVVGGGFPESDAGERAILQAAVALEADGLPIQMARLRHAVDDGGLIGWVHLAPKKMVTGYDGLLALDIGGTNVRCGVVLPRHDRAADLSAATVARRIKWTHRDDKPGQKGLVDGIAGMLERTIAWSRREGLRLAPFVGIGCPGVIRADGSIARGAQNLPGDWERATFHLPTALCERLPFIGDEPTRALMHNDGVVQGLSELPFMQDVERWAVLTIGTGLGNASYLNRKAPARKRG